MENQILDESSMDEQGILKTVEIYNVFCEKNLTDLMEFIRKTIVKSDYDEKNLDIQKALIASHIMTKEVKQDAPVVEKENPTILTYLKNIEGKVEASKKEVENILEQNKKEIGEKLDKEIKKIESQVEAGKPKATGGVTDVQIPPVVNTPHQPAATTKTDNKVDNKASEAPKPGENKENKAPTDKVNTPVVADKKDQKEWKVKELTPDSLKEAVKTGVIKKETIEQLKQQKEAKTFSGVGLFTAEDKALEKKQKEAIEALENYEKDGFMEDIKGTRSATFFTSYKPEKGKDGKENGKITTGVNMPRVLTFVGVPVGSALGIGAAVAMSGGTPTPTLPNTSTTTTVDTVSTSTASSFDEIPA